MKPNDEMAMNELLVAQDARMVRLGEYRTRKGLNLFTDALGKAEALDSVGGDDATFTVDNKKVLKCAFTAESDFRLWQIDLSLAKMPASYGRVLVEIYTSENSTPSVKIAETTIKELDMGTDVSLCSAIFNAAPDLVNGAEYWLVIRRQDGGSGEFLVGAQDGGELWASLDGGELWTEHPNTPNFKLYSADPNGIDNIFVSKIGSQMIAWFACGGKLYRSDMSGNVTLQNGDLGAGVKNMYFNQSVDGSTDVIPSLRYTYGGKPRRINLVDYSEVEISAATGNARNILSHGAGKDGFFFYLTPDDPNGVFSSEEISSHPDEFDPEKTFASEIPAPKCGDDLTAMASLAGILTFFARKHKYALLGEGWQTFSVSDAPAIGGTFSQKSVAVDGSYIYYATDTGINVYNGSIEYNLCGEDKNPRVQNIYDAIEDKSSIVLEIYDDRLHVFYSDLPTHINNKSMVYNLNLKIWESFDSGLFIGAAYGRDNQMGKFLVGHSRVGALMILGDESNQYDDLGAPIKYMLSESWRPYGQPAQIKRISKWRPEFETVSGKYSVDCGFSFDFGERIDYAFSVDLHSGGILWDTGRIWDNGEIWDGGGLGKTKMTTRPTVHGEWRRCALHYKHFAAGEPATFISHTLTLQTQRIR
jgi:hypothetical protein